MLKLAPLFPLRLRGRAEELENQILQSLPLVLRGGQGGVQEALVGGLYKM
jgi:hypothetical protein